MGDPSPLYLGTIVALYNIGCLAGCVVAALYGNKVGRRKSVFWGCVVMLVGAIIQFMAYGAPQMIAGRLVSGLGNGMPKAQIEAVAPYQLNDSHAKQVLTHRLLESTSRRSLLQLVAAEEWLLSSRVLS